MVFFKKMNLKFWNFEKLFENGIQKNWIWNFEILEILRIKFLRN